MLVDETCNCRGIFRASVKGLRFCAQACVRDRVAIRVNSNDVNYARFRRNYAGCEHAVTVNCNAQGLLTFLLNDRFDYDEYV